MAALAVNPFLLPHPATLCPPPLQFTERTRRITVRRRILRKPTRSQHAGVQGPLDDIIAEIKSNILELPPDCARKPILLNWGNPLKAPSTWAVTPLPVSRAPSDRPLAIRKNRENRSSASGSSMGDPTSISRNNSSEQGTTTTGPDECSDAATSPWPTLNTTGLTGFAGTAKSSASVLDGHITAQRPPEGILDRVDSNTKSGTQRRPSRLRRITNGFPRLRRIGTGDTSTSITNVPEDISSTLAITPPDDLYQSSGHQEKSGHHGEAASIETEQTSRR